MELYNLYSYIEVVDDPDTFVYLWSAHYDNAETAEEDAWNETCLRYQDNEQEFQLPTVDDMIANLQDCARKEGKSAELTKEMYQHAIDLAIEARDDYIDYYAIPARLDDRDYEDLVVIDADEYE